MDKHEQTLTTVLGVLRVVGLVVGVICAVFLYRDATNLKERGARLSPVLWAILGFLFSLLGLALYFTLRSTVWQRHIRLYEEDHAHLPQHLSSRSQRKSPQSYPYTALQPTYQPPHIEQLIGECCLRCQKRISMAIGASLCTGCGCGVHDKCAQPPAPGSDATHCPICGGNPSTRIAPDYAG